MTVEDDYAWLKDENWQEVLRKPDVLKPDIRAYLEAENRYTDALLAPTKALQEALVREMRGRIKEDDAGVPMPDGPFAYSWKFREGGQYEQIGRQPREGGSFETILDGDALARTSGYFKFGGTRHSPDHRLVAWSADLKGSEYFTIRVRDWATGADLPDVVERAGGGVVWGRDSRFFYYVERDENHRPLKVFRHLLGTRQEDDRLVYEEKDTGWFVTIGRSASGRFCVVSGGDHDTSEQRLLDLGDADAEPRLVEPRQKGVRYEVADRGEELYVLTNRDDAIDFRIDVAPLAAPGRANWRPVVPHRPGTYILDLIVTAGHLARLERSNALPSIAIRDLADGQEHTIAIDEQAYALDMIAGYEFDTTTLRFAYSSMTTPAETWDYDMASRQRTLRKRQQIPSGHDPARYVTTRLLARAADGAEVPVSLLHRRGLVLDGTAPLLLYGYGSYGMAMPAS